MALLGNGSNLRRTTKILLVLLALAGVAAVVAVGLFENDWVIAAVLGGGLVLVGLLVLGFAWLVARWREGRSAGITSGMSQKFAEGVRKFRSTGKDLSVFPWYVLVGEPGAGKTEAIRHANIPSPRGFNAPRQGDGGTQLMDWWFTNNAILLDTAGRIMFEGGADWKEFLQQLRRARPACPINGMVLAIPVTSLLLDSTAQITEKAGQIAEQFDSIQRELQVRFPVYVVITKTDKIPGFREFFQGVTQPSAQSQMLGWSNPETDLDAPFRPEAVEQHLEGLKAKLKRRRLALIRPSAAPASKQQQLDDVDSLYAFPDALASISGRLRTYLETIFMPGEYALAPLFVRGIYFTCAMQEGKVLHEDLAKIFGKSPEDLPEELRMWDRNRSFFLRDFFLEKAFREKGLVTGAANVSKQQQWRNLAGIIAGTAAAATILGFSIFGHRELQDTVGRQARYFDGVLARAEQPGDRDLRWLQVVADDGTGKVVYRGGEPAIRGGLLDSLTVAKVQEENLKLAKVPIRPSTIFSVWAKSTSNLNEAKRRAHQAIFDRGVAEPLVTAARGQLASPETWKLSASAKENPGQKPTDALCQLLLLGAAGEERAKLPLDARSLGPFFGLVLGAPPPEADANAYESAYAYFHPQDESGHWAPPPVFVARSSGGRFWGDVDAAVQNFIDFGDNFVGVRLQSVSAVAKAIESYQSKEIKFQSKFIDDKDNKRLPAFEPVAPQFERFAGEWGNGVAALHNDASALGAVLTGIGARADLRKTSLPEMLRLAAETQRSVTPGYNTLGRFLGSPADPAERQPGSAAPREAHTPAIKTRLEDAAQAFGRKVDEQVAQVGGMSLAQLDADFLGRAAAPAKEPPKWRYEQRLDAYEKTKDEMTGPGPLPGDFSEIARQLQAVDELSDAFPKVLSFIWSPAPNPSSIERRADACITSFRGYATARRRFEVWQKGFEAFRTPADAQVSRSGEDDIAGIPFTGSWPKYTVDPRYRPKPAAEFFGAWKAVAQRWKDAAGTAGGGAGDKELLDAARLRTTYNAASGRYGKYCGDYARTWGDTVPGKLAVNIGSWEEFQNRTSSLGGGEFDNRLNAFAQKITQALAALPKDAPQSASAEKSASRFGASLQLSQAERNKGPALLGQWQQLGGDVKTARRAIAVLPSESVEALFDVPRESAAGCSTCDYWWALSSTLFRTLKDAGPGPSVFDELVEDVDRHCLFPLPRRQAGAGVWVPNANELDPKQLPDLKDHIAGIAKLQGIAAAVSADAKLPQGVAADLATMRGSLTQADVDWLRRLGGLADALEPPFDCQILVLGANDIPKGGPTGPKLSNTWKLVKLRQQQVPPGVNRVNVGAAQTQELGQVGMQSPPIWFEFSDVFAGPGNILNWGDKPGQLAKRWPVNGLLQGAKERRDVPNDPNAFDVCLMIPGGGAAPSPFWLRLRFEYKQDLKRSFPHDWP